MKERLSAVERRVLGVLQGGLPKSQSPYADMARRIGITADELLSILKGWKEQGKLRRIGAIVNQFRVGRGAGAMVVWRVEPDRVQQIGELLAGFEQVSHAYERQTTENWQYNLYTMVHAQTPEEAEKVVDQMSRTCGISDYRILRTERELKKVPPKYIMKG